MKTSLIIRLVFAVLVATGFSNCTVNRYYGYGQGGSVVTSSNRGYYPGNNAPRIPVNTGSNRGYYPSNNSMPVNSGNNGFNGFGNFYNQQQVRRQPSPIYPVGNGMVGGGYSAGFNPQTGGWSN